MESKDKFLLCFMLFCFIGSSCGICINIQDMFSGPKPKMTRENMDAFYKTFFNGFGLDDKCMSAHNLNFWKFSSSVLKTTPDGSTSNYIRRYFSNDEIETYSSTGSFEFPSDKKTSYLLWRGQGGIPGGTKTGFQTGRIYILDIQPKFDLKNPAVDGTVITYYTCFNGKEIRNDNVCIVQAPGGTVTEREKNLSAAKKILETLALTSDLKNVKCY